jgi:hypothetical protein
MGTLPHRQVLFLAQMPVLARLHESVARKTGCWSCRPGVKMTAPEDHSAAVKAGHCPCNS